MEMARYALAEGVKDFYEVLHVAKDASPATIDEAAAREYLPHLAPCLAHFDEAYPEDWDRLWDKLGLWDHTTCRKRFQEIMTAHHAHRSRSGDSDTSTRK